MRLRSLFKPEYLYRPTQLLRRLRLTSKCVSQDEYVIDLPWGLRLTVNPHELIGGHIARTGIYDLAVSEALWRLLDPGETALDIGSNIGYTASILAQRTGPCGFVYCFEPHPDIFVRLSRNVSSWGLPVIATNAAVSDEEGSAVLRVPRYFSGNQGTASLAGAASDRGGEGITVPTLTLDGLDGPTGPIGVMKVDVEGHEAFVFRGASHRLQRGEIRDIVFEDHGPYPTPAMQILQDHGYRLYALHQLFRGPHLATPGGTVEGANPPSYLATLDSGRAKLRFAAGGWRVLTHSRSRVALHALG